MVKTIVVFITAGILYLYLLEALGNFITRNLEAFTDRITNDFDQGKGSPKTMFSDSQS